MATKCNNEKLFDEIKALAYSEMKKHEVPYEWRFDFDNACARAGACHYFHKKITLSKRLVGKWTMSQIRDTILHEIAHVLAGRIHGHDDVWKATAARIGCSGRVCYSDVFVEPKFILYCGCGRMMIYRYRYSKQVFSPNYKSKQRCKLCNTRFCLTNKPMSMSKDNAVQ